MKDSLAASKGVMKNYLSELLTDKVAEPLETSAHGKKLDKLLQDAASKVAVKNSVAPVVARKEAKVSDRSTVKAEPLVNKTVAPLKRSPQEQVKQVKQVKQVELKPLVSKKSAIEPLVTTQKAYRKGSFQALFFDVAGLVVAVPLIELGGIHNAEKTNTLVGKPSWFRGVMLHREQQINVVDTALWVMPEKCDENLLESLNYQYIVMLSGSQWGLSAENLVDTVTLEQEDVKWLDAPSKRPWLAGLVKERMCALLDVEALIKLLDDGAGIIQN